MDGISKDFPGVQALRSCRFELRPGEIHALVGENGAGKSTLMKILAGVYRRDAGRIRLKGAEVDIPTPRAAQQLGISIIHQELKLISDRVTVMRDGQYIATLETKDASIDRIITMMVGRTIYEEAREAPETANAEIVLDVQGLNRGRMVRDVSFNLRRGEILGLAGLVGAGRTEVARAVFGADRPDSGTIVIHGKLAHIHSPADAVHLGIGYLSEDRKRFGLAIGMNLETNILLATLRKFSDPVGRVNFRRTRATAMQRVHPLQIALAVPCQTNGDSS